MKILRLLLVCLCVLGFYACSDGATGGGERPSKDVGFDAEQTDAGADGEDADELLLCTPDPDLIEAQASCQRDDHCPCGTYCSLGRCTYDCASDADCSEGEVCGTFGTCRSPAQAGSIRSPSPSIRGALKPRRSSAVLPAEGSITVDIVAEMPVKRARFVARGGSEILCPGQTEFALECEVDDLNLEAGDTVELEVRRVADDDAQSDDIAEVIVYTENDSQTITLPSLEQLPGYLPASERAALAALVDGKYRGTIRLLEAGGTQTVERRDRAVIPVSYEVDLSIWAGAEGEAIVRIKDPLNLLSGGADVVGQISFDPLTGLGSIDMPRAHFLDVTVGGQTSVINVETVDAEFLTADAPRTASMTLSQEYRGSGAMATPSVKWALDVVRVGEETDAAPSAQADAEYGYDPLVRLEADTPFEARWLDIINGIPAGTENTTVRDFAEGWIFNGGLLRGLEAPDIIRSQTLTGLVARVYLNSVFMSPNYDRVSPWPAGISTIHDKWTELLDAHPGFASERDFVSGSQFLQDTTVEFTTSLPCAFTDLEATFSYDGVTRSTSAPFEDDYCDKMARVFGCTVRPRPTPFSLRSRGLDQGIDFSWELSGNVISDCDMASMIPSASDGPLCSVVPSNDTSDDWYVFGLNDQVPAAGSVGAEVGDLMCRNTGLGVAFPIDSNGELDGSAMLERCLAESATLADAPVAIDSAPGSGLAETVGVTPGDCVNVARMLMALGMQSRTHRLGSESTAMSLPGRQYSTAITTRLLSRWLKLHAYYATQGTQQSSMAAALGTGSNPTETVAATDFNSASLQGWDLIFAPHIVAALMDASGEELVEPDYRFHRSGFLGRPGSEQKEAVAAVMLETLARQARLTQIVLEQSSSASPTGLVAPVAALMPRLLLAQAMAADMHRRALDADASLQWNDNYFAAARRASVATAETLQYLRVLVNGENPLGISDADLPLYFNADTAAGPSGRFGAISDFLLGTNIASDAWAPTAVAQAQTSLAIARQSFIDESDRRVRESHENRDFVRWIEDVRDEYDATLRDYCGPLNSYIDKDTFDPYTCFVDQGNPVCQVDFDAWYQAWSADDIMGRFCLNAQYTANTLSADAGFFNPKAAAFAKACFGDFIDDGEAAEIKDCADNADTSCLVCAHDSGVAPVRLERGSLELATPIAFNGFRGDDSSATDIAATRSLLGAARSVCQGQYPTMSIEVPLVHNPREVPECVTGTLGEANLEIVAAVRDVEQARAAIAEHTEAYDVAIESCWILEDGNAGLADARAEHYENMKGLRLAKTISDGVATAAGAVKDCAATAAGSDKSNPISAIAGSVAIGASCVAGGVEAVATVVSSGIELVADNAQQKHDDLVAGLEADMEFSICANDARMELVGLKTASIDIERAAFDLKRARASLFELSKDAERVYADGRGYLEQVGGMQTPDAAGDLWFNEKVTTYTNDFKTARRATYLAVRAVEYEYQISLGVRQAVFDAKTPAELRQNVLDVLWQDANTRGINGNTPTELTTVVSLRDDILQLGDASGWPDELRPMTTAERFHVVLANDRYAIYDEDGTYQGQRIPFTLAPLGALGFETRGVSIYSQNDCAERLWAINASVLGDNLYKGSDTQNVRLDVLKRNTFFSQWCGGAPGAEQFQVATVQPSRNLFRVPGVGAAFGDSQGNGRGVEDFSRARIQAFFNVSQGDLELPEYASGQTAELAARGLYGDYAIFIPAAQISLGGENGLVFDNVDDILLRFDYVSVAN